MSGCGEHMVYRLYVCYTAAERATTLSMQETRQSRCEIHTCLTKQVPHTKPLTHPPLPPHLLPHLSAAPHLHSSHSPHHFPIRLSSTTDTLDRVQPLLAARRARALFATLPSSTLPLLHHPFLFCLLPFLLFSLPIA